jgi:hypothetical protein
MGETRKMLGSLALNCGDFVLPKPRISKHLLSIKLGSITISSRNAEKLGNQVDLLAGVPHCGCLTICVHLDAWQNCRAGAKKAENISYDIQQRRCPHTTSQRKGSMLRLPEDPEQRRSFYEPQQAWAHRQCRRDADMMQPQGTNGHTTCDM